MAHTGRCLCTRYQFEATGEPLWVAYCHCESCRRCTGAPVAAYVGFDQSTVRFNTQPQDYQSSPGVIRSACERCGTPLAYLGDRWPTEIHLFRSTFEKPEAFRPTRHVFFNEREADFDVFDDLPRFAPGSEAPVAWGQRPAVRVLYLCTGNSARSILAEAITNLRGARRGEDRIIGHSAGSQPTGEINPGALALLKGHEHLLGKMRSKSWDEFTRPGAPSIDLVITLCDETAGDCPAFPGAANRLPGRLANRRHWGLPDPATGVVSFADTYARLETLIEALIEDLCSELR